MRLSDLFPIVSGFNGDYSYNLLKLPLNSIGNMLRVFHGEYYGFVRDARVSSYEK